MCYKYSCFNDSLCLASKYMSLKYACITIVYILYFCLFIWGFYVAFNTVQVVSQVVARAEETSTYSSSGFCTVNYRPTGSNYQLSHLRLCRGTEPQPQKWEARVLPLCHRGPFMSCNRSVGFYKRVLVLPVFYWKYLCCRLTKS